MFQTVIQMHNVCRLPQVGLGEQEACRRNQGAAEGMCVCVCESAGVNEK